MDVERGKRFLETCRRMHDAIERIDRTIAGFLGLPLSDLRCLHLVAESAVTASGIARALGLSSSAVTALIDRLEAAGLVGRVPSPDDRRSVLVELRKKGRVRLARLQLVAGAPLLAALSRHGAADIDRCEALVGEIALAIDDAEAALRAAGRH